MESGLEQGSALRSNGGDGNVSGGCIQGIYQGGRGSVYLLRGQVKCVLELDQERINGPVYIDGAIAIQRCRVVGGPQNGTFQDA